VRPAVDLRLGRVPNGVKRADFTGVGLAGVLKEISSSLDDSAVNFISFIKDLLLPDLSEIFELLLLLEGRSVESLW